jgi:hypothetical protein
MMRGWQFLKERFDPASHALMIGAFSFAQARFLQWSQRPFSNIENFWFQFLFLFVFYVFFFLLLRCYDEIKDAAHDAVHNQSRPIPRGLVSIRELKNAITFLLVALVGLFGIAEAAPWSLVVLGYSLLMFREFFIGKWLRPHLTTYAMSHTFVIGLCTYALMQRDFSWGADAKATLCFALANWFVFNVFEFARKTFAPSEEKPEVDSYSKIFRPAGAGLLTLSQWIAACFCLWRMQISVAGPVLISALSLIFTMLIALRPTAQSGRWFRQSHGIFLVLFYLILSWELSV